MFINELINAIIQVLIFSIVPVIWWLITARKKENFFKWIGLKLPKTDNKLELILWIVGTFIVLEVLGRLAIYFRGDLEAAESVYTGMGAKAIPTYVTYAVIQTAMSEEILFRGFLLKRFCNQFGFKVGSTITALIFGMAHLFIVWGKCNVFVLVLVVAYPMVAAFCFAWINEKKANGSILPSWLLHGALNILEHTLAAFS